LGASSRIAFETVVLTICSSSFAWANARGNGRRDFIRCPCSTMRFSPTSPTTCPTLASSLVTTVYPFICLPSS